MELLADSCAYDWRTFFRQSYEDVIRVYRDARDGAGIIEANRPDVFRALFEQVCGKREEREPTPKELNIFYRSELYDAMWLSMLPREGVLRHLINRGKGVTKIIETVRKRFNSGGILTLDHGAGLGQVGLAIVAVAPDVRTVLYDHTRLSRSFIANLCQQYFPIPYRHHVTTHGIGGNPTGHYLDSHKGEFHFVHSSDVMEHLIDPLGEAKRISDALVPGGIAMIFAFFCSGPYEGFNLSHLRKNEARFAKDHGAWNKGLESVGLFSLPDLSTPGHPVFEKR